MELYPADRKAYINDLAAHVERYARQYGLTGLEKNAFAHAFASAVMTHEYNRFAAGLRSRSKQPI